MCKIRVALSDIIQKLQLAEEDGYSIITLKIDGDGYCSELSIVAHNDELTESVEYGSIPELSDDIE